MKLKKGSKAAKEYMASIRKMKGTSPKKMGALPVGFKGSFLGYQFDIVNQYTIDGGVTAIIRDSEFNKLFELNGRKEDELKGAKLLYGGAISYWNAHKGHFLNDRDKSQLNKRIENFVKQLNKEVKDFNSGKDKTTKKVKPVKIVYTPEVKKLSLLSEIKTILKDNNKILVRGYKMKTGKIRKISGTSTHKDSKSHNVNIRVVSGIGNSMYYLRDNIEKELQNALIQFDILKDKKKKKQLTDPLHIKLYIRYPNYIKGLKNQLREANKLINQNLK